MEGERFTPKVGMNMGMQRNLIESSVERFNEESIEGGNMHSHLNNLIVGVWAIILVANAEKASEPNVEAFQGVFVDEYIGTNSNISTNSNGKEGIKSKLFVL